MWEIFKKKKKILTSRFVIFRFRARIVYLDSLFPPREEHWDATRKDFGKITETYRIDSFLEVCKRGCVSRKKKSYERWRRRRQRILTGTKDGQLFDHRLEKRQKCKVDELLGNPTGVANLPGLSPSSKAGRNDLLPQDEPINSEKYRSTFEREREREKRSELANRRGTDITTKQDQTCFNNPNLILHTLQILSSPIKSSSL